VFVVVMSISEVIDRIRHRKDDISNPLGLGSPIEPNGPNVICAVCGYKNPPGSKRCLGCSIAFARYAPLLEEQD